MRSPKGYIRRASFRIVFTNVVRMFIGNPLHNSWFQYCSVVYMALTDKLELSLKAKTNFSKHLKLRGYRLISLLEYVLLSFDNYLSLNQSRLIICHSGMGARIDFQFGPNVLVYDRDRLY